LCVALAGFPASLPIHVGEGIQLAATTVGELRAIKAMPCNLEILIPYRLAPDSVIAVNPILQEWESER
jgi:hypothetical protein